MHAPTQRFLEYKTTTRQGYKEYVSNKEHCKTCKHRDECLIGDNEYRTIRRHVWKNIKKR